MQGGERLHPGHRRPVQGGPVGTQAYADYVNSTGGVNGRKIVVDSADDGYTGAGTSRPPRTPSTNDFALVGGFSLHDNYGGAGAGPEPGRARRHRGPRPDHQQAAQRLQRRARWTAAGRRARSSTSRSKYPTGHLQHVGTLVADQPSAEADWAGEKYVMEQVGYKVIYDPTFPMTQTDFTQNVIAMKNAGVKMLFIDQMPEHYASALLKDLAQQNFHPMVILGAATYTNDLVRPPGGRRPSTGAYFDQNASLYLGGDAGRHPGGGHLPPLGPSGLARVQARPVHPVRVDLGQPVRPGPEERRHQSRAGARSSRPCPRSPRSTPATSSPPATRRPRRRRTATCSARSSTASAQRLDDPPMNSSTNGYRCDGEYISPPPR